MKKKNWIRAGRAALMALLCFAGSALANIVLELTISGAFVFYGGAMMLTRLR